MFSADANAHAQNISLLLFSAFLNLPVKEAILHQQRQNGHHPMQLPEDTALLRASQMTLYAPFGIPFSFPWPLICASRLIAGVATFPSRLATTCEVESGALGRDLLGFKGESSPELDKLRVSERLGRNGIGVEGLDERNYINELAMVFNQVIP